MSMSSNAHVLVDEPVSLGRRYAVSLALVFVVLNSGAAVMMYEFIAVRILQREFGSLLDIWAAEISVCMAGLALGYSIGGHIADRFNAWWPLGVVLMIGGLCALPMEPLAYHTAEWLFANEQAQPSWWWPVMAAGACTFVPILALGTVLPQAIRLQVRSLERVGSGAGWIASLSTVGSILGVMLFTFGFLPRVGLRATLITVAVFITALGAVIVVASLIARKKGLAAIVLLGLLLFPAKPSHAQIRFDRYSGYHHILVVDKGNTRMLRFDDTRQSQMSLRNPVEGGFEYTDFFHVPMIFNPEAEHVAFIGLGGGTGPKAFLHYYPNVQIDAVEIDPLVVDVARDFFSLPEDPRLKVTINDGRVFLRRARKKYDVIVMDAYSTSRYGLSLPYHLTTVEFFKIARERLKNAGCLVYNTVEVDRRLKRDRVQDLLTTLGQVFEFTYAFKAKSSLNTVLVAVKLPESSEGEPAGSYPEWPEGPVTKHPLSVEKLTELTGTLLENEELGLPRLHQRIQQISPAVSGPDRGMVLTDDFAPTDVGAGR
ncbi:MAG: fused MFS/spermidine synthase [Candidatus Hydrogenedentota bacterium]